MLNPANDEPNTMTHRRPFVSVMGPATTRRTAAARPETPMAAPTPQSPAPNSSLTKTGMATSIMPVLTKYQMQAVSSAVNVGVTSRSVPGAALTR